MHTFVTCFYDLERKEERSVKSEFYIDMGLKMINMFKNDSDNINFIMYIDQSIYDKYNQRFLTFKNLKIKVINFEELIISKILDKIELNKIKMPKNSSMNLSKDTYNFFKLMISKTYFLDDSIKNTDYTHYTWIDFGILKIIKEEEYDDFYNSMLKISKYNGYKIKFPTCKNWIDWYSIKDNRKDYLDLDSFSDHPIKNNPSWLFLGGILSGSRDALLIFSENVNNFILEKMIKHQYIIWEVNIWSYVYLFNCENIMESYNVNSHDINMFKNF